MTITRLPGDGERLVRTHDAVVVVPGLMGTELLERGTGHGKPSMVWGLADPRWYARSWSKGGLAPLALTPAEQGALGEGRYDPQTSRIMPGRLLRSAASLPVLRGVEPYTDLIEDLERIAVHPDAVREFGYDWRLPVAFNAPLLAGAMAAHLAWWRAHPAHQEACEEGPLRRPGQLVIVAHSMGGLLVQELARLGGLADVRLTITLGTPFHGAVKAAELVNTGRGTPMPLRREELRDVVATMPGIHDLLPFYRCLRTETAGGVDDVVRPRVATLVGIGADPDLTERAYRDHEVRVGAALAGHRALIGTEQPTTQSMSIRNGVVHAAQRSYEWHEDGELQRDGVGQPLWTDERGDSTVYRYAATLDEVPITPVVQSHGGLAKGPEALGIIRGLVLGRVSAGAKLGAGELALDVPDAVGVGESFDLVVTGEDDPALVEVQLTRLDEHQDMTLPVAPVGRVSGSDGLCAPLRLPQPGLYRVGARTGGADPVTQLVICEEPDG